MPIWGPWSRASCAIGQKVREESGTLLRIASSTRGPLVIRFEPMHRPCPSCINTPCNSKDSPICKKDISIYGYICMHLGQKMSQVWCLIYGQSTIMNNFIWTKDMCNIHVVHVIYLIQGHICIRKTSIINKKFLYYLLHLTILFYFI